MMTRPSCHRTARRLAAGSARGFTLTEMLLVIVMLGLLSAMLMPRVSRITTHAKLNEALNIVANDLEQAVGLAARLRRPVTLAWAEHFEMIIDAIAAERKIKGWRREKKEAMMRGDYDALPWLAKRSAVRTRSFEARPRGLAPQDEDPHHPHPAVRALASLEGRVPQGKEQE